MITHEPEGLPMEQIVYEVGTGPRYQLLAFTKDTHQLVRRYGGDPVLPNLWAAGPPASHARTNSRLPYPACSPPTQPQLRN
jgi:hypothetical protein